MNLDNQSPRQGRRRSSSGIGRQAGKTVVFCAPVILATAVAYHALDIQTDESVAEGEVACAVDTAVNDSTVLAPADTLWNPVVKAWLTAQQIELLNLAYGIGYQDGGEAHANLLQAVLLQESIAGQLGRVGHLSAAFGKRSYGVMQVKVTAARDTLRRHPEMGRFSTDEELIVRLMSDDEFNLRVASLFLRYLRQKTDSVQEALVAYNIGLNGSRMVDDHDRFRYVRAVDNYLSSVVTPFNKRFGGKRGVVVASM